MKHEQSLADLFNKYIAGKAQELDVGFHSFSLDGQDRDAGADYVLTDAHQFSLIEFKYAETDLKSEARKPRRLELCNALLREKRMRDLHDRCHYVAWKGDANVYVNTYRAEVCNRAVFGMACDLPREGPNRETSIKAREFADDFLTTGNRSLALLEFEEYLNWLLNTSGSTRASVELLTYDANELELVLVRFPSVGDAYQWFQDRRQHRHTLPHVPRPPRPRM
ncbi:hypothetical protein [Achromobacter xylosoxidans]|uniref:hypothetical protein n=1 Tax=Alcaligenes xylosoxydans xylosoxydans TaxID=85698 RepID=UPI0012A77F17|nr:hypothetical protein [Achromobacter xylosoxidans]CUR78199.1 hypothetical protein BN2910_19050 [Achromobacter xylosoxidans]